MAMKNYIKILAGCLICILSIASCDNFLNVKPQDKFLSSQVFRSEKAIQNALNGIYIEMAQKNLYGGNLTMTTLSVLGQSYDVGDNQVKKWYPYVWFMYDDENVKNTFRNIWNDAYRLILNINRYIKGLNETSGVISKSKEKLLKGEAYGLRAMLYFDLLRLFGPVPKKDSTALSIPYYAKPTHEKHELLPANLVINKILNDLNEAKQLLSKDPITKQGVHTILEGDGNDFYSSYRNRRMNYYAVLALQARVQLWAGHDDKAYTLATKIINNAQQWFPWVNPQSILTSSNPNRVFSTEVLFGVDNRNMYDQYRNLFSPELFMEILMPNPDRLGKRYENNVNDYRITWFELPNGGPHSGNRTFVEYADVRNSAEKFRYFQPLIRMSEMYYIAAETAPDKSQGLGYLDVVRNHRGLNDLPSNANLNEEITKAYQKEFYGEGQIFFYYKRKAFSSIPSSSYLGYRQPMSKAEYVPSIPNSETNY